MPSDLLHGPAAAAFPPSLGGTATGTRWRRAVNGVKTAALLGALGGSLVWVGSAVSGPGGTLVGLVAGLAAVAASYWHSDRLALRWAGARPMGSNELPAYRRIVQELAAEAQLPMPRLYVSAASQPNAFATGRGPAHAAICVTEGLLGTLDVDELRAVIAHELAHIANRDVLLTSIAAALATGISALADMLLWLPLFSSDDDDQPGPLGLLAAAVLAPIAATLLHLALSRTREFDADDTAADLLGDGRPLARALSRIEHAARRRPMTVPPAQASAYIVNPLTGRRLHLAALFSTHPPTDERIFRLLAHPRRGRARISPPRRSHASSTT